MANTYSADFGAGNTNKSLNILNNLGLTGGGNVTLECWVKTYDAAPGAGVRWGIVSVGKVGVPNVYYQLTYAQIGGVTGLRADRLKQNVAHEYALYTVTLDVNTWIHVALTYDGTNLKIYTDGTLQTTVAASGNGGASSTNDHFAIAVLEDSGTTTYTASNFAPLKVDDVRVWNVARTATQINDNKSLELVGNETNLVAYYKLNNNANDATASAFNLTNNNTVGFVTDTPFNGVVRVPSYHRPTQMPEPKSIISV